MSVKVTSGWANARAQADGMSELDLDRDRGLRALNVIQICCGLGQINIREFCAVSGLLQFLSAASNVWCFGVTDDWSKIIIKLYFKILCVKNELQIYIL